MHIAMAFEVFSTEYMQKDSSPRECVRHEPFDPDDGFGEPSCSSFENFFAVRFCKYKEASSDCFPPCDCDEHFTELTTRLVSACDYAVAITFQHPL